MTGSWDNTAKLWSLETGHCLRTYEGHENLVTAVALTPDGGWLATGSSDRTAMLWDVATGRRLRAFSGHVG